MYLWSKFFTYDTILVWRVFGFDDFSQKRKSYRVKFSMKMCLTFSVPCSLRSTSNPDVDYSPICLLSRVHFTSWGEHRSCIWFLSYAIHLLVFFCSAAAILLTDWIVNTPQATTSSFILHVVFCFQLLWRVLAFAACAKHQLYFLALWCACWKPRQRPRFRFNYIAYYVFACGVMCDCTVGQV